MVKLLAVDEETAEGLSLLRNTQVLRVLAFIGGLGSGTISRIMGLFNVIGGLDDAAFQASLRFFQDPIAFVQYIVLSPLLDLIFSIGNVIIGVIVWVTLGTDRAVGVQPGSQMGLLDVPVVLVNALATAVLQLASTGFAAVGDFNSLVRAAVDPLGPFAFPIVTGLLVVEAATLLVTAYLLARVAFEAVLFLVEAYTQVPVDTIADAVGVVGNSIVRGLKEVWPGD